MAENQNKLKKQPLNPLQFQWFTLDPDYSEVAEARGDDDDWKNLDLFKSGHRLGNIQGAKLSRAEHDLTVAFECFSIGLKRAGISFYNDVAIVLELSNSEKGFRSKMLTEINQKQQVTQTLKQEKRGLFGQRKEE